MALTADLLKANQELAGLTEAQLAAISTLSTNDEANVLNTKIGQMHGQYEADVLSITGLNKNGDEKSFDYMKRALTEFKTKADGAGTLQSKITAYETEITDLKKQISEGKGDEVIRQQLKDAQTQLNALNTQAQTEKQNWEKEKETLTAQFAQSQIAIHADKASAGLKFKPNLTANITGTLVEAAKSQILSTYKSEIVKTSEGKQVLQFRNEAGEILLNPSNLQKPYTFEELLKESPILKDVLETDRKQPGTGTEQPGKGNVELVDLVDISSAKTQVIADELIEKHLMQNGMLRGTVAFKDAAMKIRNEQGVDKLPIR